MSLLLKHVIQTAATSVLRSQLPNCGSTLTVLSPLTTTLSQCVLNFQAGIQQHNWKIKDSRVFKRIRGGGRPLPEGVTPPEPRKYGFRVVYPADGKYTTRPLPVIKLGGRDPATGKVVVKTIGGGHKKKFRWVDHKRHGPEDGSVLEEKVFQVRYDPCRTARIALVASGDHKRWILASEHMKVGDIVKTCNDIPRNPVKPEEGDAYALAALPQGTMVHNIHPAPKAGGVFCRAAGTSGQLLRRIDNKCLVQLPSKQQILVDEKCMAVVGKVSNVDHGKQHIGSPNRLRWLGKRPRSGLWHRKDGYCGRKVHPPKSIKDLLLEREEEPEVYQLSFPE